jgi:hypothetical protein
MRARRASSLVMSEWFIFGIPLNCAISSFSRRTIPTTGDGVVTKVGVDRTHLRNPPAALADTGRFTSP